MLRKLSAVTVAALVVSLVVGCGESPNDPDASSVEEDAGRDGGDGDAGHDAGMEETDGGRERTRGLTLLAPLASTTTYLMDEFGEEVHRWQSDAIPGVAAYLLENGNLLRTAQIPSERFPVNGVGGRLDELDWDGNVVRSFTYADQNVHAHHDVEVLPNGNILMIVWEYKSREELIDIGRRPQDAPDFALLDQIVELNPITQEIVWEWRLWDHLVQGVDSEKDNFGAITDPGRVDVNVFPLVPGNSLTHFNSIDYNPELDQILVSTRQLSEVWIIDHGTTTSEAATDSGGLRGKGGRLLYRWGNPQNYGAGTELDRMLLFQHDAKWILPGLPALGSVMLFDNGDPILRRQSRVVEFTPPLQPDGTYAREEDQAFGPTTFDWMYWLPEELFAGFISGAERLANGNTSITSGTVGHLIEIDPAGEAVWEHRVGVNVFRGERYPLDFPGFEGRELSPKGPLVLE